MKFLDRLAFNRLVSIIGNFILSLLKIINPKIDNTPTPFTPPKPPKKPRILPWKKK